MRRKKERNEGVEEMTEVAEAKVKKHHSAFLVEEDSLYIKKDVAKTLVANFHLKILSRITVWDEGKPREKSLEVALQRNGEERRFFISDRDFFSPQVRIRIMEEAGTSAIIYGALRDLQIATQELSGDDIPEKIITTSPGLTAEGNYLSKDMLITPEGFVKPEEIQLDLRVSSLARNLGFLPPDGTRLPQIGAHLEKDFLELKSHAVTFPLMGHIALAPFASSISEFSGKEKVALHLEGPSGGGKTFLGTLGMAFFGDFGDRSLSWACTPNALEAEGYFMRDTLFFIDDYKTVIVPPQNIIRVLQGYSDGHGRARLKPNSRVQDALFIRGLLLSTGEDFVSDVESVTGRTIRIHVEPEKNEESGRRCWENKADYRMFLPGMIRMVISDREWKAHAGKFVESMTKALSQETLGLSNGLRMASNWSLNALGFNFFINYLQQLGVIDGEKKERYLAEYLSIVVAHLRNQVLTLRSENPAELFFRIISEEMATGAVRIIGMNEGRGKIIGQVKAQSVMIFPDSAMAVMAAHYRAIGQKIPITRNSLRDALAQEGLICRPKDGRWTTQFRGPEGKRYQGWDFDLEQFKTRVAVE